MKYFSSLKACIYLILDIWKESFWESEKERKKVVENQKQIVLLLQVKQTQTQAIKSINEQKANKSKKKFIEFKWYF